MDDAAKRRSSPSRPSDRKGGPRFYQRQPRPRAAGKFVIGSPVGPVLKNGIPLATQEAIASPASTAVSYENAYPVKPMDHHHDKENSPPVHHPAASSRSQHTSKSSRALHVLSSITHTFSRSSLSLASFKSNRNVSGASAASSIHAPKHSTSSSSMRRPLIPRFDFDMQSPPAEHTTEGTNDRTTDQAVDGMIERPDDQTDVRQIQSSHCESTPLDPKLIYTAQPSAYWSGRFVALRDRYQSELLEPATLQCVLEEHARRSQPEPHLQSDVQSVATTTNLYHNNNNDFARPYETPSSSTLLGPPPRNLTHHHHSSSTRQPSTLLGTAPGTGTSHPSRPPLSSGLSRLPLNRTNSTPSHSQPPSQASYNPPTATPRQSLPSPHNHNHQPGTMPPPPPPTLHTPSLASLPLLPPETNNSTHTAAKRRELILLTSEDARRARVFATLQSYCATPEARESLKQWQTGYARLTGREGLLPLGEKMVNDKRGGGGGTGRGGLAAGWGGRSLASSTATATGTGIGGEGRGTGTVEKKEGWTTRLRVFSGRRSRAVAVDGQGGSQHGGDLLGGTVIGVGQRYGREGSVGAASEPAWAARAGTGLPLPTEVGGRKMRVRRIQRVEHGF